MRAVESPSLDEIWEECAEESDVDDDSDEDSDVDEEELEQRYEERRQLRSERRLEERRQGRAWCVQALLEAMAPIPGPDCAPRSGPFVPPRSPRSSARVTWRFCMLGAQVSLDRATSFKFACERLRVFGQVLAASHVIGHASVLVKARVVTLTADAQDNIIDFARAVFAS